ncbi:MAG: FIST C-terminal domain-containing protein [Myxococcales bacterium]|nr:FIST C-terminal domain-containing protein [Myxococcales bacterium]
MSAASQARSAYSAQTDSASAAAEIISQLGDHRPRLIVFFATVEHDGAIIGNALAKRFPTAHIAGCSSNGEFTDRGYGTGGVAALSIGEEIVSAVASTLAILDHGVEVGILNAATALHSQVGLPIHALPASSWVGIGLLEGAKGQEELINESLGHIAPLIPFVGGSAGDRIRFDGTWVYAAGQLHHNACALILVRPVRPFAILKTCHFTASPIEVEITKADPHKRLIHELDGQPAVDRYAQLIGVARKDLSFPHFWANPLGLMIDGEPWLRSVVRPEGSSLFFACAMLEGMRMNLMTAGDIVQNAATAFDAATAPLGVPPRAAILFNCAYRMLEVQLKGLEAAYHHALSSIPHAGFHSNGESYLGHINQTLTGIVFS